MRMWARRGYLGRGHGAAGGRWGGREKAVGSAPGQRSCKPPAVKQEGGATCRSHRLPKHRLAARSPAACRKRRPSAPPDSASRSHRRPSGFPTTPAPSPPFA